MKTKTERALWFLESYGVNVSSLSVRDSHGQQININPGMMVQNGSKYEALEKTEKTKIKEVLYIMDRFCVGDAAYHALSEHESGLPRSYMIKQCRADVNNSFTISKTPGDLVGAQINFKEELVRKIKEKVSIF